MPITKVGGVDANVDQAAPGGSTPIDLAYGGALQANDVMYVVSYADNVLPTISDSTGATWTKIFDKLLATDGTRLIGWIAVCGSAATPTVSANYGTNTSAVSLTLEAFRGFTTGTFDKAASDNQTSVNADSSATATTTKADELVLGAVAIASSSGGTITEGGGFSAGNSGFHGGALRHKTEYKVVAATGTQTATFTIQNSVEWACAVATVMEATVPAVMQYAKSGRRPRMFGPGLAR